MKTGELVGFAKWIIRIIGGYGSPQFAEKRLECSILKTGAIEFGGF